MSVRKTSSGWGSTPAVLLYPRKYLTRRKVKSSPGFAQVVFARYGHSLASQGHNGNHCQSGARSRSNGGIVRTVGGPQPSLGAEHPRIEPPEVEAGNPVLRCYHCAREARKERHSRWVCIEHAVDPPGKRSRRRHRKGFRLH
jgi:hypothetical protein